MLKADELLQRDEREHPTPEQLLIIKSSLGEYLLTHRQYEEVVRTLE